MEKTGTLATALAHAARLLAAKPALAEQQADEILKVVPGNRQALVLLAHARRAQDNQQGARAALEQLTAKDADSAVLFELGEVCAGLGDGPAAIAALNRSVSLDQNNAPAWRALGDQLMLAGDSDGADRAYANNIRASVHDPQLMEAANALCHNKLAVAERLLRAFLKQHPTDVAAIRMLAETGARIGQYEDAEKLLARAMELSPSFTAARYNYALILHRQMKSQEALAQAEALLARDPKNAAYRTLRAAILVRVGEYQEAVVTYQQLLKDLPHVPKAWMSYGHALKTLGRSRESIDAYRRSIALLPGLGEAWWSLANLKTFRFTQQDLDAMRGQLAREDLTDEDRFHLDFALGKALEDAGAYDESFRHYAAGNARRRNSLPYDSDATTEFVRRSKVLLDGGFFDSRTAYGADAADPIFIVGMPRAGSTLIEQILASHSQIEGTMELPDLLMLARRLGGRKKDASAYLEALPALDAAACRELGEEYIGRTRVQRKLGRPFFIDKMPNNFQHIGLIQLILPKARVIDARRHPIGCGLSNFKQHYAHGQAFAYDLADIGRYYRDYVELMAHYDAVLPGRIHRVLHENMVADPEREIRRLLDYCGVPFEQSCLEFDQNERAVRTASSEQVRQPIYREGVEQWRNYAQWLSPLEDALGPVLQTYPNPPVF